MNAFIYYTLHSIKNGIKKLFKTWIIIFVAIIVLAGALGTFLGKVIPEEEPTEPIPIEEEMTLTDEEMVVLIENICGIASVLIICFISINANKSGSAIFTEPDVVHLFASPIKPNKILSFKLILKLLSFVLVAIYMLLYIPNWLGEYATPFSIFGVMLSFMFTLMFAQIFQSILYLTATNHYWFGKLILPITVGIPVVILSSFGLFYVGNGYSFFNAVKLFFNSNMYRGIPIIGSIKALLMTTINVNVKEFFLLLLLNILYVVLLTLVSLNIHADFYEDAMAKSEETAELLREAEMGIIHRKKDRPDRIIRNKFNYGNGANVYFFKEMYNRFRFAPLHFFTKTLDLYLLIGMGVAIFSEKIIKEGTGLIAAVIILTSVAFYRSLGNSLTKDISKPFFLLIPEKATKKLFYSLISGTMNCLLDILPAYLIVTILFRGQFLLMLTGLLFTLSMDYYSSTVETFISLTLEGKSVAKGIQVIVQLTFIYLGLIPDVAIILVLALVFKVANALAIGFILSTVLNILLGTIFFYLCPRFLEPKIGRRGINKEYEYR